MTTTALSTNTTKTTPQDRTPCAGPSAGVGTPPRRVRTTGSAPRAAAPSRHQLPAAAARTPRCAPGGPPAQRWQMQRVTAEGLAHGTSRGRGGGRGRQRVATCAEVADATCHCRRARTWDQQGEGRGKGPPARRHMRRGGRCNVSPPKGLLAGSGGKAGWHQARACVWEAQTFRPNLHTFPKMCLTLAVLEVGIAGRVPHCDSERHRDAAELLAHGTSCKRGGGPSLRENGDRGWSTSLPTKFPIRGCDRWKVCILGLRSGAMLEGLHPRAEKRCNGMWRC
eukprot:363997-Chlamydomonas_euryale.AAC.5